MGLVPQMSRRVRGVALMRGWPSASLLLAVLYFEVAAPAGAQAPTQEPITPIPAAPAEDPRRLVLGDQLFHDTRLSHDNSRSCGTCHDTRTNGASANRHDVTPQGRAIALNTLTIFNAA